MTDAPARRCPWARSALDVAYHDTEWGVPQHDDRALFEFLTLEGAQAGLSWSTILNKRPAYRAAYCDFDVARVAAFGDADRARLLADAGIVRNRLKIDASIGNARAFITVQREFGSFDRYGAVGRAVGGPEAARFQVRRQHNLLRLPAGHRRGQRPPAGLPALAGAGRRLRHRLIRRDAPGTARAAAPC